MSKSERLYLLYGLSILAALVIGIVACYHVMNGGMVAERIIADAKGEREARAEEAMEERREGRP